MARLIIRPLIIIFLKMETFGHLSTPSNIVYYNEKLDTPN